MSLFSYWGTSCRLGHPRCRSSEREVARWALVSLHWPLGLQIRLVSRRRMPRSLEPLPRARQATVSLPGGLVYLAQGAAFVLASTFLFQSSLMLGPSMSPTLGDQQRVFVNKLAYLTAALQDGGAFMFRHPLGPSKSVVKRVIARSGDRVHIVDDRVSVKQDATRGELRCSGRSEY